MDDDAVVTGDPGAGRNAGPALPRRPVIGVLHPGVMGAAVGSALKPEGGAVIWAAAGRSITTSKRAELADLVGVPDLAELARRADVIISVCPPRRGAGRGRAGGGGVGGPARPAALRGRQRGLTGDRAGDRRAARRRSTSSTARSSGRRRGSPGSTVLWLSGRRAPTRWPSCSPARRSAPGCWAPSSGPASALKACFALQSKALPALWLAMSAAARRVRRRGRAARRSWSRTGVDDAGGGRRRRRGGSRRGAGWGRWRRRRTRWRRSGVPDGFSRAAAEIYRRLRGGGPDRPGQRAGACAVGRTP